MKSGCSESNASASWVVGCRSTTSCHQTSFVGPGDVLAGTAYDEDVLDAGARRDRLVDRGLEGEGAALAVAAVGGDDQLGVGVLDARGQRLGGEPAEDDRVRGAEAGAGQHRDSGLGDHRQVDRDAVAGAYAELGQRVRGLRDLGQQVGVRDRAGVARLALEVDRDLVAVAGLDVPVEAVDRDVEPCRRRTTSRKVPRSSRAPRSTPAPTSADGPASPRTRAGRPTPRCRARHPPLAAAANSGAGSKRRSSDSRFSRSLTAGAPSAWRLLAAVVGNLPVPRRA